MSADPDQAKGHPVTVKLLDGTERTVEIALVQQAAFWEYARAVSDLSVAGEQLELRLFAPGCPAEVLARLDDESRDRLHREGAFLNIPRLRFWWRRQQQSLELAAIQATLVANARRLVTEFRKDKPKRRRK